MKRVKKCGFVIFSPYFLLMPLRGIKTRLNFYVNTSYESDGDELLKTISARVKELRGMLDSLDVLYSDSEVDLRDFLIIGKRPPQIDGVDKYDRLQDILEELESPNKINMKMWQMTCTILQSNFTNNCITYATQAFGCNSVLFVLLYQSSRTKRVSKVQSLQNYKFSATKVFFTLLITTEPTASADRGSISQNRPLGFLVGGFLL